ncbi:MAG: hypothetical protein L0L52_05725 [Staphylococcus equorum]|uniref:Uncharacterized protein n=1 Tax=Staphylococcus equorum TaxID=246432 RepID=A0AAW7APB6_9STAP|nr:hypothetical protein [Staphylococcus equorum]MDG0822532.1 hypothetical protein [Staphylococcus equorum]MDG0837285.1 hypothetical protein [Staphylococcus equorum]MDK9866549.1 hypothetical protein [Staphylococcus equorum]MDK9872706.1 hypothetical protein [Staphylococcus equorum]MDK9877272.1 hypothetical protein [Staphylococcus equorum]
MFYGSILLIILGIVLLVLNKRLSKKGDTSKKQSLVSFGVMSLVFGLFGLIGVIIMAMT